jgi:hypothetical protein
MAISKHLVHRLTFVVLALISSIPSQGVSMTFFSKEEVVLASPFEAKVTFNGKSVTGAKVTRSIEWQGKSYAVQETTTDAEGSFSFAVVKDKWRASALTQFISKYKIKVYFDEQEYIIWFSGKVDESLYGELGGAPENITCELTDEDYFIEGSIGLHTTSCKIHKIKKGK